MIFIRSTIFNIFFYVWTLLMTIPILPLLLTPPKIVINAGRGWAWGIKWGARIICGIKWEVRGKQYIPKSHPAIIASKHQSAWETAVFYLLCDMPVYVLKKELQKIPVFGWYTKAIKTIAVDRTATVSAIKDLIMQAEDRLKKGRQLILFPEGTRVKPGETGKYQAGIAAIYKHVNIAVTPVALNSGVCWPKNSYMKYPGTITFEFLPPIDPGLEKAEFMKELEEKIETASSRLLSEADKSKRRG